MTRNRPPPSARQSASSAQRQFRELKTALHAAEAHLANLRRSLHAPVIRPPRGRIPGHSERPSYLDRTAENAFGNYFSRQIISGGGAWLGDIFGGDSGDGGGSFGQSATQFAARLFDAAQRGQRIR